MELLAIGEQVAMDQQGELLRFMWILRESVALRARRERMITALIQAVENVTVNSLVSCTAHRVREPRPPGRGHLTAILHSTYLFPDSALGTYVLQSSSKV